MKPRTSQNNVELDSKTSKILTLKLTLTWSGDKINKWKMYEHI